MYRNLYRRPANRIKDDLLSSIPFDYVGDRRQPDRDKWPIKTLAPYMTFDLRGGDGLIPNVGPALGSSGSVVDNQKTPYLGADGIYKKSQRLDGGNLSSAVHAPFSLGANTDVVIMELIDIENPEVATYPRVITLYSQSSGYGSNPTILQYLFGNRSDMIIYGGSTVTKQSDPTGKGWLFAIYVIDRDGVIDIYFNGSKKSGTINTPSLLNKSDMKLSIGQSGAVFKAERLVVFQGDYIADLVTTDLVDNVTNAALGIANQISDQGTFSRGSIATKSSDSKLFFFGLDTPCSGDENGIKFHRPVTNKVYRNYNPSTTAGLTATGGSLTIQNDATALAAAGIDLTDVGPNVFEIVNTSGSTVYVYATPQLGNTNTHSNSIYARVVSGAGAQIGLYDQVGTTFSNGSAISDNYVRTENNGLTPVVTTDSWCLSIPNNCAVRFTGHQCEESYTTTDFIPNNLTAATVVRPSTSFTIEEMNDDRGTLEFDVKLSTTTPPPTDIAFIANSIVSIQNGTGYVYAYDGTNFALNFYKSISDNAWHHLILRWNSSTGKMQMHVDDTIREGNYDGTWNTPGGTTFSASSHDCDVEIKNVRLLRN